MSNTSQASELTAAMAALEAQRPILGDAVVDAALGPMREKLATLEAQTTPNQQRKIATILFADVSGYTALSETMDAELIATIMNDFWALIDGIVDSHGGRVDKHIGDAVMALWGADVAREDDPEQAIRAALAMQSVIEAFCASHSVPLAVRIGVNTGPVVLGQMGTKGEYTAMGDAVNLASRLEAAASVDSVLISHDTYRHVRGVFDVDPQDPLTVKGKAEPLATYIVKRAKPRAFRLATRGVEGVETHMIGRDGELLILQDAFRDAADVGETRLVIIVGDAGVGKSRLLYEFDNWLELLPDQITYFKGRSTATLEAVPYSLFRDLFAFRFGIRDSDTRAVAMDKFRSGYLGAGAEGDGELSAAVGEVPTASLTVDQADLVGHWLGFDFSQSEAVRKLLGSPEFADVAKAHLMRYLRLVTADDPVVILLEDIHWADDDSLDLISYLLQALPQSNLLIVCVARPSLYERRALWSEGEKAASRIGLRPLSRRASLALVNEILRKVDEIPHSLRDLIVNAAEGNPFYTEELIKMFIDQGVIMRSADADKRWQVQIDRLKEVTVPPTLTGLLQARLDALPQLERELLQRAAIVGRQFWDGIVADLAQTETDDIRPVLQTIRDRELIFQREHSAFDGSDEFVFKHNLLRDVAYERVLLKWRQEFHGRVARWLEAHAGERLTEYLGLIAQHYELAGEDEQAAAYLLRVGNEAMNASAFGAARRAFERVIALRESASVREDISDVEALVLLGQLAANQGDYGAAEAALRRGLAAARSLKSDRWQAEALSSLGRLATNQGAYEEALSFGLDQALPLALEVGGATLFRVIYDIGGTYWQSGDLAAALPYGEKGLALAKELGDTKLEAEAVNLLGIIANDHQGDLQSSTHYYLQALALARAAGNIESEIYPLLNLGDNSYILGDYPAARSYGQTALQKVREVGLTITEVIVLGNLGQAELKLGNMSAAWGYAHEGLQLAREKDAVPYILFCIQVVSEILAAQGDRRQALRLLWLAHDHPAADNQLHAEVRALLEAWQVGEAESAAARFAAAEQSLDDVVSELLDKTVVEERGNE